LKVNREDFDMGVYDLYRVLSVEQWWMNQSRAMRWIAARFYCGVESLEDLRSRAKPHIYRSRFGEDCFVKPELSEVQVDEIILLR
jgi:hypothetical protein